MSLTISISYRQPISRWPRPQTRVPPRPSTSMQKERPDELLCPAYARIHSRPSRYVVMITREALNRLHLRCLRPHRYDPITCLHLRASQSFLKKKRKEIKSVYLSGYIFIYFYLCYCNGYCSFQGRIYSYIQYFYWNNFSILSTLSIFMCNGYY